MSIRPPSRASRNARPSWYWSSTWFLVVSQEEMQVPLTVNFPPRILMAT